MSITSSFNSISHVLSISLYSSRFYLGFIQVIITLMWFHVIDTSHLGFILWFNRIFYFNRLLLHCCNVSLWVEICSLLRNLIRFGRESDQVWVSFDQKSDQFWLSFGRIYRIILCLSKIIKFLFLSNFYSYLIILCLSKIIKYSTFRAMEISSVHGLCSSTHLDLWAGSDQRSARFIKSMKSHINQQFKLDFELKWA